MWEEVSFVRRGRLRTQILEALITPNNPTDLAKRLNSHRPTVSQAISELTRKKLVKRLNPGEKNMSLYGLTAEGIQTLKRIHQMKGFMAADSDGLKNPKIIQNKK
ncbi:MAG: hypothetical protein AABY11_01875 [archaeon]